MSGNPDQEFFGDGIAEDVLTELSKLRWLFVIARNSSFTYKGKAVDIKQVGRELGVRYVLEGSVRRSGNRVRVTRRSGNTSRAVRSTTCAPPGSHNWRPRITLTETTKAPC
jgi:adenylate cyclase